MTLPTPTTRPTNGRGRMDPVRLFAERALDESGGLVVYMVPVRPDGTPAHAKLVYDRTGPGWYDLGDDGETFIARVSMASKRPRNRYTWAYAVLPTEVAGIGKPKHWYNKPTVFTDEFDHFPTRAAADKALRELLAPTA